MLGSWRTRCLLAALVVVVCGPAQSWADSTVVIRPAGTVSKSKVNSLTRTIQDAVAPLDGVVVSEIAVGEECAVDPVCLASAGRDDGVSKVVGVHVAKSGAGFTLTFLAADATTGAELAREEIANLTRKNLDSTVRDGIVDFVAKLSGTQEATEPPVETTVEPPVEESPVEESPVEAPADEVAPTPAEEIPVVKKATTAASAKPPERQQSRAGHALGLGVSLGEPTRFTATYRMPAIPVALEVGLGSGVLDGNGLHLDGNLSYEQELGPVRVKIGAGYRLYLHHYDPMSIDELDSDVHQGVQGVLGASYSLGDLELFGELVPGFDFSQSASCTFVSGAYTLCPHQAESRDFLHMGVGARYWIEL